MSGRALTPVLLPVELLDRVRAMKQRDADETRETLTPEQLDAHVQRYVVGCLVLALDDDEREEGEVDDEPEYDVDAASGGVSSAGQKCGHDHVGAEVCIDCDCDEGR